MTYIPTQSDREDGIYRTITIDGVDHFLRTPPDIRTMCAPLMGISIEVDGKRQLKELSPEDRLACYTRAFRVLERWRVRKDLFRLALYRRQLAEQYNLTVDSLFMDVALSMQPALSAREWRDLSVRMPEDSGIRKLCIWESRKQEMSVGKILAA